MVEENKSCPQWKRRQAMKIVSTQVSPIFRAYTNQLRTEYARAGREGQFRQAPARGFETVTLSEEAKVLAALNGAPMAGQESERVEQGSDQEDRAEETAEETPGSESEPQPAVDDEPSHQPPESF